MVIAVGVVGAGFIGEVHLDSFADIEGVRIAGVVEKDENLRRETADRFNCSGYGDVRKLLANERVDLVDICTPTPTHLELLKVVASEGKDIICEKPLALEISEGEEMMEVCEEAGVELYVGHVLRFFPEYVKMREKVLAGEVGRPAVVRTFRGGAAPSRRADWYGDVGKSGGLLVDLLIHDFDWLRWTFGEVKSVYTQGITFQEGDQDLALVSLELENGTLAHVEGSWAHPEAFPFTTMAEIAGSKGLIQFDSSLTSPIEIYSKSAKGEGWAAPESPLAKNPWYRELKHFLDCIESGKPAKITPKDGLEALRISTAALQSLEKNSPVEVGDIE